MNLCSLLGVQTLHELCIVVAVFGEPRKTGGRTAREVRHENGGKDVLTLTFWVLVDLTSTLQLLFLLPHELSYFTLLLLSPSRGTVHDDSEHAVQSSQTLTRERLKKQAHAQKNDAVNKR